MKDEKWGGWYDGGQQGWDNCDDYEELDVECKYNSSKCSPSRAVALDVNVIFLLLVFR